MSAYLGELAALFTALCWSFTSIFFTLSGRLVGAPVVNRTRLVFALLMVAAVHWITEGKPIPWDAGLERWGWLGLSGLIGFVVGDACLFQAYLLIGPRLAMLIMALSPVMGAALAWGLLGETLAGSEILGIALAISGVLWVVADRTTGAALPSAAPRAYALGLLFALGGALGQAAGLIASKEGIKGDFPALSGNVMRLTVSTLAIWGFTALSRQVGPGIQALREHPRAVRYMLVGAIFGPFIGVTASLIAVQHAAVGVASTLMSMTPIILLPISRFYFHEDITRRAVVGTIIAVAGTAILFLA